MGIERFVQKRERLIETLTRKGEVERSTDPRERVPAGQHLTQGFPVLDLGFRPPFDPITWTLRIFGEVERELLLTWDEFQALPRVEQVSDFHCVTTWSKLDVVWGGVKLANVSAMAKPRPTATHLIAYCAEDYTTNLRLTEALGDDVLLADELDGEPLPLQHGGPVRLVVPKLYGWKSAKFLRALEFSAVDKPGFWEVRGYHNHGDPWREERFGR